MNIFTIISHRGTELTKDIEGKKRLKFHCPSHSSFLILLFIISYGLFAQSDEFREAPYWRQALGGEVIGNPVAQVESVVVVTDGGNLKSYSSQGTPLWDFYARGRLTPFVGRSREGTSYIGRTNGLLIAVNRSGRELWRINLGAPLISPVLTGWDGRIFVFTDKKITCLTSAGFTLWSRILESRVHLVPIMDIEGGIILVLEDGKVHKFDSFGGVYSYSSPFTEATPAAAASLDIEGWGHSILLLYEDRHIELAYPSLGYGETLRGKLELPSPPLAAIGGHSSVSRKDEAAALLRDGSVILFSPEKRRILWKGTSHIRPEELREISASPQTGVNLLFDERGIYVLTKRGASGFALDGRRLWHTSINSAASVAIFGDDGILYSGGTDWILYSYRIEDRVRAKQRLLYGEKSDGSYGTGNPGPSSQADFFYRFTDTEIRARLAEIRQAIKNGEIGSQEKEYAALLMETAGSAAEINVRHSNRSTTVEFDIKPAQTQYRVEAATLLAFLGSRETIPFLTELFIRDPDNLVRAAAVESIGKIGVDPEGIAMRAFENAIYPPSPLRDENILTPLATAIGALCRFSGPPLSEAGVRLLTFLSGTNSPPGTQRRAQREIRSL